MERFCPRKDLAPDLRRLNHSKESLTSLFHNLLGGPCSFVYNCLLDMLIERHLPETAPALRPCQFLSVRIVANNVLKVNINQDIFKTLGSIGASFTSQTVLAWDGSEILRLTDGRAYEVPLLVHLRSGLCRRSFVEG